MVDDYQHGVAYGVPRPKIVSYHLLDEYRQYSHSACSTPHVDPGIGSASSADRSNSSGHSVSTLSGGVTAIKVAAIDSISDADIDDSFTLWQP